MNACTVASGQLAHVCSMSAKCGSPKPKQCKCTQTHLLIQSRWLLPLLVQLPCRAPLNKISGTITSHQPKLKAPSLSPSLWIAWSNCRYVQSFLPPRICIPKSDRSVSNCDMLYVWPEFLFYDSTTFFVFFLPSWLDAKMMWKPHGQHVDVCMRGMIQARNDAQQIIGIIVSVFASSLSRLPRSTTTEAHALSQMSQMLVEANRKYQKT